MTHPWSLLSIGQLADQYRAIGVKPPESLTNKAFVEFLSTNRERLGGRLTPPVWYVLRAAEIAFPPLLVYDYSFVVDGGRLAEFANVFQLDLRDPNLWLYVVYMLAYADRLTSEDTAVVLSESFLVTSTLSSGELMVRARRLGLAIPRSESFAQLAYDVAHQTKVNPTTLPFEIVRNICKYLPIDDVMHLGMTCKGMLGLLYDEHFWQHRLQQDDVRTPDKAGGVMLSFRAAYRMGVVRFSALRVWLANNPKEYDYVVIMTHWSPQPVIGVAFFETVIKGRHTIRRYSEPINMAAGVPLWSCQACNQTGVSVRTGYLARTQSGKSLTEPHMVGEQPLQFEHQLLSISDFLNYKYRRPLLKRSQAEYFESWESYLMEWPGGAGYYSL